MAEVTVNVKANTSQATNEVDNLNEALNQTEQSADDLSDSLERQEARIKTLGGAINIVIGNYDTNTRVTKDLINTVVINPNRDLESYENLGGDDFNGRAYLGTYQTIGAQFADHKDITMSAGQSLYLTGSEYANDFIYNLGWTGGSGTANLYLPGVVESPVNSREAMGYKRMIRFIGDNTLSSSTKININVSGSDSIGS